MHYNRTVFAYHGCDATVAERLLQGEPFTPSHNDFDWLGSGVYFWEFGRDRALRFAHDQQRRSKVTVPAVIGAIIQLGNCFDLMDTRFTEELGPAFDKLKMLHEVRGTPLPVNSGVPDDRLRRLDCAVLNLYLKALEDRDLTYDTVRCGFEEGPPAFAGSGIRQQSHIQIAVRNPACIVGLFRPR